MTRKTMYDKRGPFAGKVRGYYQSSDDAVKEGEEVRRLMRRKGRILKEV